MQVVIYHLWHSIIKDIFKSTVCLQKNRTAKIFSRDGPYSTLNYYIVCKKPDR